MSMKHFTQTQWRQTLDELFFLNQGKTFSLSLKDGLTSIYPFSKVEKVLEARRR